MVSEKEMLMALLHAIGALATRLTGETLVVKMTHHNGKPAWHPLTSLTTVEWCSSSQLQANLEVSEHPPAEREESSYMPDQS